MRIKNQLKTLTSALVLTFAVLGFAEDVKYTKDTSMEVILFTPELREVMAKHVPDLMGNPEIDQASVISLGELATYVPDQLTEKVITAILDDLNKVKK